MWREIKIVFIYEVIKLFTYNHINRMLTRRFRTLIDHILKALVSYKQNKIVYYSMKSNRCFVKVSSFESV